MIRKQYKMMAVFMLVFVLFFGANAATATPDPLKEFTFNEGDIHKPIFVVTLKDDKVKMAEGVHAIYRIFFGSENGADEEGYPFLNFWTDDKGSKRVQY